jgi:hypothetical protein
MRDRIIRKKGSSSIFLEQVVDILKKCLEKEKFEAFKDKIGLV